MSLTPAHSIVYLVACTTQSTMTEVRVDDNKFPAAVGSASGSLNASPGAGDGAPGDDAEAATSIATGEKASLLESGDLSVETATLSMEYGAVAAATVRRKRASTTSQMGFPPMLLHSSAIGAARPRGYSYAAGDHSASFARFTPPKIFSSSKPGRRERNEVESPQSGGGRRYSVALGGLGLGIA
jgi:hypothetical protein